MSVCVPGMGRGRFPHRVGPQSVAGGTSDVIDFSVTEQDRLAVPMCWPSPCQEEQTRQAMVSYTQALRSHQRSWQMVWG